MYDFSKVMESQLEDLDNIIEELSCEVDFEQPKCMFTKKVKGKEYYYCRKPGRGNRHIYLGKPESERVKQFVDNRNKINQLEVLTYNKERIMQLSEKYRKFPTEQDLAIPASTLPQNGKFGILCRWETEHYETNPREMSNSASTCVNGKQVRSKGEACWYNCLSSYGIPFRYECKMVLYDEYGKEHIIYPDFLIMCCDESLIIIEHCGMLLDDEYADRFKRKVKLYLQNGYVMGDNLIVFSDNKAGGINTAAIEKLVKNVIMPRVYGAACQLL